VEEEPVKRWLKTVGVVAVVLALPLAVTACGGSGSTSSAEPATVEQVPGTTHAYRVTLSVEAAKRLRVETAVATTDAGRTVIPFSAVLYAPSGTTCTYVNTKPRTFVREAILVDHIQGDRAVLSNGPAAGTRVVTVGAVELSGVESGRDVSATCAGVGSTASGSSASSDDFDPADFGDSATVDNKWMPYEPGTQFVYTGKSNDGEKRLVFTVTDLVKVVAGVRNVVIWDRDYTDGELVEAELAFFAQDNDGNVWHTGEYPEDYEGGKIVDTPAWLAGVKGSKAGIEMKASPKMGAPAYAQGYAPPPVSWNDHAKVFKLGQRTCVPVRCYTNVLITREFNPGEAGSQLKYFARGVGNVRVGWLGKDPDEEVLVLAKLVHLSPAALAQARAAALKLDKRAYKTQPGVYGKTPAAVPR
jgi:hypothetical protein